MILKRKSRRFIGIHDRLIQLLKDTGLNKTQNFILFGSIIRCLWNHEQITSINIALTSKTNLGEFKSALNPEFNYTFFDEVVENPKEFLLQISDFSLCEVSYYKGYFYYSEDFFINLNQRKLIVNYQNISDYNEALTKLLKYLYNGYSITHIEFIKFLSHCSTNLNQNNSLKNQFIDGVVLENLITNKPDILTKPLIKYPDLLSYFEYLIKILKLEKLLSIPDILFYGGQSILKNNNVSIKKIHIAAKSENSHRKIKEFLEEKSFQFKEEINYIIFNNTIYLQKNIFNSSYDLCRNICLHNECIAIDITLGEISFSELFFEINTRKILALNTDIKITINNLQSIIYLLTTRFKIMKKDLEFILNEYGKS